MPLTSRIEYHMWNTGYEYPMGNKVMEINTNTHASYTCTVLYINVKKKSDTKEIVQGTLIQYSKGEMGPQEYETQWETDRDHKNYM